MDQTKLTLVEAERERLREKGYSDEDIRQILIQREVESSKQQTAGAGAPNVQMPMQGVLYNAAAAASYGRATIFGIRRDVRVLFELTASAQQRLMAGFFLACRFVVVAFVCFAIYQEVIIHVINASPTSTAQREQAEAQAAVAKRLNEIQLSTAKAQNCEARLNLTNTGKPAVGLMQGDPKFEQIIGDCKEYLPEPFIKAVREFERQRKEEQAQVQKAQEEEAREAAQPRSYEQCLDVVAARHVLAQQAATYKAAHESLAAAGPSDPEIAGCMKLSKAQALAVKPTTLSECRDWWIAEFKRMRPDLVLSEVAEKTASMEMRQEKAGQQGFVAKCMAGNIEGGGG